MKATELKSGSIFFVNNNCFLNECEVIENREKAVKIKVQSYVAYPGVNDKTGSFVGYAWVPKKALIEIKDGADLFKFARWFTPKYYRN